MSKNFQNNQEYLKLPNLEFMYEDFRFFGIKIQLIANENQLTTNGGIYNPDSELADYGIFCCYSRNKVMYADGTVDDTDMINFLIKEQFLDAYIDFTTNSDYRYLFEKVYEIENNQSQSDILEKDLGVAEIYNIHGTPFLII